MYNLILDTSTEECLLALCQGNNLIHAMVFAHGNNLSRTLIPSIQELLEKEGLAPNEIKKIFVGIGPGSYTGTRVGVATAKSLAFGLSIPLAGFCSLLAFLPSGQAGSFAAILPAQSGSYFVSKGAEFNLLVEPQELQEALKGIDYLVCRSPERLPSLKLPVYPPVANLERLLPFLPAEAQMLELFYLHSL